MDYNRAVSDYTKAIELNIPELDNAYYTRGLVYIINGKYKEGIDDWEYAIKLNPDLEENLRNGINTAKEKLNK
jgi:tetratricopeptide (TPR) repeat protein